MAKRRSTCRAFTLVEILVSLVLIVLLAGILLPVLSKAKERAKYSVDINALHQIALASAMYTDGEVSVIPDIGALVGSGHLEKSLLISPLDRTEQGIANVVRGENPEVRIYPFKCSFISIIDVVGKLMLDRTYYSMGGGGFVSTTMSQVEPELIAAQAIRGTFFRVMPDASVVQRKAVWQAVSDRGEFF